jgi:hypothetical protein
MSKAVRRMTASTLTMASGSVHRGCHRALEHTVERQLGPAARFLYAVAGVAGEQAERTLVCGHEHAAEKSNVATISAQLAGRAVRACRGVVHGPLGDTGPVALDEVGAAHVSDDARTLRSRNRVFPYASARS